MRFLRHFRLIFINVVLAACLATVPAPGLSERDLGKDAGHSNHSHLFGESDETEWQTWYEDLSPNRAFSHLGGEQRLLNDTASRATKGTLRTLVVNVGTPTRSPSARDLLSENYAQASTRIGLMSRGMASVEVDIFGRDVIVPDVANTCTDYAALSSAARDAIAGEVSLSAYRSIDYILPHLQGEVCGWAGRGQLGGNTSWNLGLRGQAPSVGTIVHEWGHQYSLPHLRAIRCTKDGQDVHLVDRAGRSAGQCATAEYGGAFSIMGPAGANNSAALTFGERAQLGWLRDGEQRSAYEGVFTLGFDGPLSLLWLQNSEGDLFQIEFVKAFVGENSHGFFNPFDSVWHWFNQTPNYTTSGVMVKYISQYIAQDRYPAGYHAEGYVIDATPHTMLSTDAAFRAGTSFVDPTGSLTVEVLSVSDQSAEVRIKGVPFVPHRVKSVQATATDTRGVFDVSFQAAVADPPVTHYEIQVSTDFKFTNPQTFIVSASPGRVVIPKYIDFWTNFRVAAVSTAGRGEFSEASRLVWSKSAKVQDSAEGRGRPAKSVVCRKNQKVRTVARAACASGWQKVG